MYEIGFTVGFMVDDKKTGQHSDMELSLICTLSFFTVVEFDKCTWVPFITAYFCLVQLTVKMNWK